MNAISKHCPNCGNDVAAAKASGDPTCLACGHTFDTSETPPASPRGSRHWLFWTMLIGPTALIFLMLGLMKVGANQEVVAVVFGIPGFLSGIIGSVYCGVWLARRIAKQLWLRAALALVLTAGLLGVNYTISVFGCIFIPRSL